MAGFRPSYLGLTPAQIAEKIERGLAELSDCRVVASAMTVMFNSVRFATQAATMIASSFRHLSSLSG
jgi:hypothetical protein